MNAFDSFDAGLLLAVLNKLKINYIIDSKGILRFKLKALNKSNVK
jgi:hypothetical protein